MMDKLAIFRAMSPENQKIALEAVGIGCGDEVDEYGESNEANEVPTWAALDVSVPRTSRGPIADSQSLFKDMVKQRPQTVDAYGMPMGDDDEAMLATGII